MEHEEKERIRQEAHQRKQREAYLLTLSTDFDRQWNAINNHAERGTAADYDEAKRAIVDLADAHALASDPAAFDKALRRFMVPPCQTLSAGSPSGRGWTMEKIAINHTRFSASHD